MTAMERLTGLGLTLPPVPEPRGTFAPWVQTGSLLFLSGAIGTQYADGQWSLPFKGKVGTDLDIETAKASARLCALNHLAAIEAAAGFDRVEQVVKLSGHVYCGSDFTKGPLVLDGASELLLEIFGETIGHHARLCTYVHTMSFHAPIETDLIVALRF